MQKLTLERAVELLQTTTTQDNLFNHALAVSCCMGALAQHFGDTIEYWQAIGYLHDYDYEQFPQEHLHHTEAELHAAGVDETAVRAIMAHGWGLCTEVEPKSPLEKSLYAVDELSGIIGACARMRPLGLSDLETKSVMKKFRDKKFAAGCDREVIQKGADLLGINLEALTALCIDGMKTKMNELGFGPKA